MLVDRIGRRRILLYAMRFTGLFFIVAAVAFHWILINHVLSLAQGAKVGGPAIVVLVSMVCYVASTHQVWATLPGLAPNSSPRKSAQREL